MKRFFFIILILLFSCSSNKTVVKKEDNKDFEKIRLIETKINILEQKIDDLKKIIVRENSKVQYQIDNDTKTLILSKFSELYAKNEESLLMLSNINKELIEIKNKLNISKKQKIKTKKIKKYIETYNQCLNFYKNGNYEKSINCFNIFIKTYKNNKLIPNAYFWLGENYFKKEKFLKAIDYYDIVLTRFPKSNKVPSALLKEGITFYKMNDLEGSKIFLQKVITEYPTTPQAYYARKIIEKYKLK